MSKIVALFFALLCILSTSFVTTATRIQPQGTQLRRIGSNKIYNAQGSINEDHHRKLQDEEEDDKDVADLLEEVAELLEEEDEESGMPTYSPTKPETEEPTSGMPTYSPTCEGDDECGKKDTPAPITPAIVEDATEPPVPAPKVTDPPVKVESKEPVPDELYGDGEEEDTTGGTDTEDLSKSQEDEEFYDWDQDVNGAETQGNENSSLSGGAMAGIIIGSLAVVGLAAGGIVMAKKKRNKNAERSNVMSEGNLGSNRHIPPPPPPPPPPMESDTDELLKDNIDYNQEMTLDRSRSVSWDAGPNPNEDSSFSRARTQKV